ncbi:MFS transporter [Sebaldella sp. S0638]|uniref:MFS transporter n=1 Tax=Sebaldella sp. S0638 TaxID=2957809 RepID=UPI00209CF656|nr:MFS transporter [Sebaldella sp. S0638]MCP1224108.1 MFS transporter [Sebaldella sp. S0638]
MNIEKLFNQDFTLMVIDQIISLFGNAILRFALPLYILDKTGSPAAFGTVLAISIIPAVIFSPVGGILADRVNRRNIMVILDFITAFLIALFGLVFTDHNVIVLISILMICLSVIQSFYEPAVQSSLPVLASKKNLLKANAVINQVESLSGFAGPVLGGLLYGILEIVPIIIISGISFFISAVMEIFIKIPFTKQPDNDGILSIIKSDLKESIKFIGRSNPAISKSILIISSFNLFLTSMIIVGIPIIIKITLSLSNELYGLTQGLMGIGALTGGILVGILSSKLRIQRVWLILLGAALAVIPVGIVLLFHLPPMLSYVIITVSCFIFMAIGTMLGITMITFIQKETPKHMIGKVMSYAIAVITCARPVGQILYGFLFGTLKDQTYLIIFSAVLITSLIAVISRKVFYRL